jgi:hypothetical protein
VRRLVEERTLGPWSAGVICLEGLGRYEHGLVGDLGLIKLCRSLLGREATADDTAQLLAHYGEWQGLASVYLLAGAAWVPPPTPQGTVEGREHVEAFHREEPRGRLGPRRRGEHTRT